MNTQPDPMRSQHLNLGAEAFPEMCLVSAPNADEPSARPSRDHRARRLASGIAGNTLLSLALMFSGDAGAAVDNPSEITAGPSVEWRYAAAMEDYEESRWPEAFIRFSMLAAEGHREAARMAWQMWRYGPELFGMEFPAGANQPQVWLATWRGLTIRARVESSAP